MADRFSPETRSRIMRAIKSRDTGPERALAAELVAAGLAPSRHARLPGSPDFALERERLAVFVHGCYWHSCPRHFRPSRTRAEAWRLHMAKNVKRDERVRRRLRRLGWRTMVVWEHEDMRRAAGRVARRAARVA